MRLMKKSSIENGDRVVLKALRRGYTVEAKIEIARKGGFTRTKLVRHLHNPTPGRARWWTPSGISRHFIQ